jgi:hypothetical protein
VALQRAIVGPTDEWNGLIPAALDAQCGYCGRAVEMNRIGPVVQQYSARSYQVGGEDVGVAATYLCPRSQCRRPSIAFFRLHSGQYPFISEGPKFLPRGHASQMPDLPDEIQADRLEAWSCFWGGDYRAAVIMGRAAVQRAVRVLLGRAPDDASGGLKADINALHQKHKISETLKEFAHETRIAGDDAAHPTTLAKVEPDEARLSLDFMDEFLEHAVALPARQAARKAARSVAPAESDV